jgi:hypothetical protein
MIILLIINKYLPLLRNIIGIIAAIIAIIAIIYCKENIIAILIAKDNHFAINYCKHKSVKNYCNTILRIPEDKDTRLHPVHQKVQYYGTK